MTQKVLSSEQHLCHKDDNKLNVCPYNLFVGTPQDNQIDITKKFRTRSKFVESDIHHIISLYENGNTQQQIAEIYNMTTKPIGRILRGEAFSHIERKIFRTSTQKTVFRGEDSKYRFLNDRQVLEIREKYPNISINKLSIEYAVSRPTISNIVNRKSWTHI
jgi:hypothetical protein